MGNTFPILFSYSHPKGWAVCALTLDPVCDVPTSFKVLQDSCSWRHSPWPWPGLLPGGWTSELTTFAGWWNISFMRLWPLPKGLTLWCEMAYSHWIQEMIRPLGCQDRVASPTPSFRLELKQHQCFPVPVLTVASSDQHPGAAGGCRHLLPCGPFTAG